MESSWPLLLLVLVALPVCRRGGKGLSRPDSEMGENVRWDRDNEDTVSGEGDGEGVVRWSESKEPWSSSSPPDKYGSSLGRFTVSSALRKREKESDIKT